MDICSLHRSKYFRGRRLHGDFDIRVEQAEFKEITLTANCESGTVVSMGVYRNGTKVIRFVIRINCPQLLYSCAENGSSKKLKNPYRYCSLEERRIEQLVKFKKEKLFPNKVSMHSCATYYSK